MLQKIHCDLVDIYGVDWSSVTPAQAECIINRIHHIRLSEANGELYGFVGTVDHGEAVGGYFVVQFPTELLHFNKDRTPTVDTTTPAETILFVLLPHVGRLLVQRRHFQILPLNMEIVYDRLTKSLAAVLKHCRVGPLVSLTPTPITVTKPELIRAFNSSRRVSRLQVSDPDPSDIPEGFEYYNPQRDRNAIIRDSRLHDYPHLAQIDLSAKKDADLRATHLARDLVESVSPSSRFTMAYNDDQGDPKVLRRQRRAKYEFHLDMDGQQLTRPALTNVLERLALDPTLSVPVPFAAESPDQMPLFGTDEDEDAPLG